MFGYVTFNVKYYILSQIFYKKIGWLCVWYPSIFDYRTPAIITHGLNNASVTHRNCQNISQNPSKAAWLSYPSWRPWLKLACNSGQVQSGLWKRALGLKICGCTLYVEVQNPRVQQVMSKIYTGSCTCCTRATLYGSWLEQFKQIRTNLRFSDPI